MKSIIHGIAGRIFLVFKVIFFQFFSVFQNLREIRKEVSMKDFIADTVAVLFNFGTLLLLNLIALVTFVFVPQGKDVLLIVSEEVGREGRYGNLISLLAGLLIWSIASEFASRYAVYVTDNTGRSLTSERVKLRKELQLSLSSLYLILPYVIITAGFVVNFIREAPAPGEGRWWGYICPILAIYTLMTFVSIFYFLAKDAQKIRFDGKYRWILKTILKVRKQTGNNLARTRHEVEWCGRLYGIYNDYIFSIRKASNFSGDTRKDYQKFTDHFEALSEEKKMQFPKDNSRIHRASLVPAAFELVEVKTEKTADGVYRWIYRIPNSFFARLHKQLFLIAVPLILIFIAISFLTPSLAERVGSPALLIMAFACWTGIYLSVTFLDYAICRKHPGKNNFFSSHILPVISIRFILLILIIVSFIKNNSYPVRTDEYITYKHDDRESLKNHFLKWATVYKSDSSLKVYHDIARKESFYPVVFVCAEGGALRTGAYSAMMLSFLQDSLKHVSYDVNFKKMIYAYSGVSGGSLGVSFFNSANYYRQDGHAHDSSSVRLTKKFFSRDYLAPILSRMCYGDIINFIFPGHIEAFDRAIALEKSWEHGYEAVFGNGRTNYYATNFRSIFTEHPMAPALFINTTEVESGKQCWISNVKVSSNKIFFSSERDLLNNKLKAGINYSTAVNFSTRFPLFSPAAGVVEDDGLKYHYVDGGYAENTGTGTMLEVLTALKPTLDSLRQAGLNFRPYVLVLRFSNENGDACNIKESYGNGITEILDALSNTRSGRTETAVQALKSFTEDTIASGLKGKMCVLGLNMSDAAVPMNWVLSRHSLDNVEKDIRKSWEMRENNEFSRLFFCDKNCMRACCQ